METSAKRTLVHDLGTFAGVIPGTDRCLFTAQGVVDWDEEKLGLLAVIPSGDNAGVSLVFRDFSCVTAKNIAALDAFLECYEEIPIEMYLLIHIALRHGESLYTLTQASLDAKRIHLKPLPAGDSVEETRADFALEVFEAHWPEEYAFLATGAGGMLFDSEAFLSEWWSTEVDLYDLKILAFIPPASLPWPQEDDPRWVVIQSTAGCEPGLIGLRRQNM